MDADFLLSNLLVIVVSNTFSFSCFPRPQIPRSLQKENGYDHRVTRLGAMPYGRSLSQQLYYTNNTLCDNVHMDQSTPIFFFPINNNNNNHNRKASSSSLSIEDRGIAALLLDRGICSFATQVRNAQNLGFAAALIADQQCVCGRPNCRPLYPGQACQSSPDAAGETNSRGMSSHIHIPSMWIHKEDGDAMKDAVVQNEVVRIEMGFPMPHPDDQVEYSFWTIPSHREGMDFLQHFSKVANALQGRARLTPHVSLVDGIALGCRSRGEEEGVNVCSSWKCVNQGRYCATAGRDFTDWISGASVVQESLRRICIWDHYGAADGLGAEWWAYMEAFLSQCHSPHGFDSAECIDRVYEASGIDKHVVEACMEDSGGSDPDRDQPNSKLDLQIQQQKEQGVAIVPSAFVNGVQLQGAMTTVNVFEAICAGFAHKETMPSVCNECWQCSTSETLGLCAEGRGTCGPQGVFRPASGVSMTTLVGTLMLLSLVFGAFGYTYHKRTRNEMQTNVRSILADYLPLNDSDDDRAATLSHENNETIEFSSPNAGNGYMA